MEVITKSIFSIKRSVLTAAIAASVSTQAMAAVTFIELPTETVVAGSVAVSNDGTVVYAGDYNLYKWTAQEGLTSLKDVAWGRVAGAHISDDGSVIGFTNVGVENSTSVGNYDAVIIDESGTRVIDNTTINTSHLFFPGQMSPDGKYLTGTISSDAAYLDLSTNTVNVYADSESANYISVQDMSYGGNQKFLKAANGYTPDAYFQNGDGELEYVDLIYSAAMSANGQLLLGEKTSCTEVETVGVDICAAVWNSDSKQITEIGYFRPTSISRDGTIVTGNGWSDAPGAKIWDTFNGTRDIRDILSSHGIDVSNWSDFTRLNVSSDGSKIVGFGTNPQGQKKPFLMNIIQECVGF